MKKPLSGFARKFPIVKKFKRPPMPVASGVVVAAFVLLGYKLLSLVPFGSHEQAERIGSANLNAIKLDVLFAPLKALQLFILKYSELDVYTRLASVAAGLAAAWLLYTMLRKWHTQRISLLTTALFITSTYFLQLGRSTNVDVLYLSVIPATLLVCMWLLSKKNDKKLPFAALLVGLILYIPGAILFIAAASLFLRKIILKTLTSLDLKISLISGFTFLVTIAPLIYGLITRTGQIPRWVGIDIHQDTAISGIMHRLVAVPDQLFVNGINDPTRWLAGTPIFEVVSIALIVLGMFAYRAGYYPAREKLVFGSLVLALFLIVFGDVAPIALLIPILYIIIANGIAYLLQSWFTVFPKNPVARPLGIWLLAIVIALSCSFQLYRYFVAWPEADATVNALTTER